jgi:hypothetical protein
MSFGGNWNCCKVYWYAMGILYPYKQCIESQLKSDSNGIGVMSIRAICSPPEGYAPAPVSCPIWGMTGEYGREHTRSHHVCYTQYKPKILLLQIHYSEIQQYIILHTTNILFPETRMLFPYYMLYFYPIYCFMQCLYHFHTICYTATYTVQYNTIYYNVYYSRSTHCFSPICYQAC